MGLSYPGRPTGTSLALQASGHHLFAFLLGFELLILSLQVTLAVD